MGRIVKNEKDALVVLSHPKMHCGSEASQPAEKQRTNTSRSVTFYMSSNSQIRV